MNADVARRDDWDVDFFAVSNSVMLLIMLLLLAATVTPVQQIAQGVQAQAYQGRSDPRQHTATEMLSWIDLIHGYPNTPWISAYVVNDGPDAVEIGINYPNARFVLNPGETVTVSRPGAQERIAILFLKCGVGETTSLRVTGEY